LHFGGGSIIILVYTTGTMRKQTQRRSYGSELTIALHCVFFHFNYNLQQKKMFWTNVEDAFKKETHG
jgi:hypothetical protein